MLRSEEKNISLPIYSLCKLPFRPSLCSLDFLPFLQSMFGQLLMSQPGEALFRKTLTYRSCVSFYLRTIHINVMFQRVATFEGQSPQLHWSLAWQMIAREPAVGHEGVAAKSYGG